jgi:hypothetical protein
MPVLTKETYSHWVGYWRLEDYMSRQAQFL